MIGAIVGDIIGSRFEFDNYLNTDFPLFDDRCSFTDDTICTIAIGYALVNGIPFDESLRSWCGVYRHPMGGYGCRFNEWLNSDDPKPYMSFGNGAAMRVSPVAWWFDNLGDVLAYAEQSAAVTHNHPEGIKGAKAVAHAIFAMRTKTGTLDEIFKYHYGINLADADLPKVGQFDETCQGCVPLAFKIVTESSSFEDAIRRAVAYGGDTDTLCAIVGSIAEAVWKIPDYIWCPAFNYLDGVIDQSIGEFYERLTQKRNG